LRSRETSQFWAALALALSGVAFAALAAWALVARSTIPVELDGRVTAVQVREEKHPGVDDVWMVAVGDAGFRHIDRDVAALLHEGDPVQKKAWDTTLFIDGHAHELSLSDDARAMLALAPLLAALVGALTAFSGWQARAFRQGTPLTATPNGPRRPR
jgi:hypothetical protein